MYASLFCLTLTACNGGGGSNNNSQPSSEPESSSAGPVVPDNAVNVFVLSGQSNMEGNTSFSSGGTDLVAQAFQQLGLSDPETCTGEGMSEVLTSTYCAGYGQLDKNNLHNNRSVNATNTEDQIMGKFVPTKTGLGSGTSKMGPELFSIIGITPMVWSTRFKLIKEAMLIGFVKMSINSRIIILNIERLIIFT